MTIDEAIKHLYTYSSTNGSGLTTDKQHNEAKRLGIQALEQQTPKMVNYIAHGYSNGELVYDEAECPNCGNDDFEYGLCSWECKFCPECGQALKWKEDEK